MEQYYASDDIKELIDRGSPTGVNYVPSLAILYYQI